MRITPRPFKMALAVCGMATLGCGPVHPGATSETATPRPTACAAGTAVPDKTFTPDEQATVQQGAIERDAACYSAWIGSLDIPSIQWSALTHTGMLAQYAAPPATTESGAASVATVIIRGKVTSLTPQSTPGTLVTITVTSVLKGKPDSTITLYEYSHLVPTGVWGPPQIADASNSPLLLPGDDVVLFLGAGVEQALTLQSYTGIYFVRDGKVEALAPNPFAGEVNGQTVDAFMATAGAK